MDAIVPLARRDMSSDGQRQCRGVTGDVEPAAAAMALTDMVGVGPSGVRAPVEQARSAPVQDTSRHHQ
ncbi:hypothetical protein ACP70R_042049 [Stipagrostis hirtigluma subsp. patula]